MSKKLDIVVAIFIAGLLAFTFGVQTGYSWTGNWNTISDGYIEIEQVNATQYYWNDENRTDTLAYPEQAASYIIFNSSNVAWAKNVSTGQIDYGGTWDAGGVNGANLSAVWEAVKDNGLTSGRDWKEKVILKGKFTNVGQIPLPSYIIVEIQGHIKAKDGLDDAFLYISGTNVDISGGTIDGNLANQNPVFPGDSKSTVSLNGSSYVSISDMKILNGWSSGIDIVGSNHVKIKKIYINDACGDGISIMTSSFIDIDSVEVQGVGLTVAFPTCNGIEIQDASYNIIVRNSEIYNILTYGIAISVHPASSSLNNITIANNIIHDNPNNWGLSVSGLVGDYNKNIKIEDNELYENKGGIVVAYCINVDVVHNEVSTSHVNQGIYTVTSTHINLLDNSVHNNDYTGIYLYSDTSYCKVTGNKAFDNGIAIDGAQIGIKNSGDYNILQLNQCFDTRVGAARTQMYGITIESGADNNIIQSNYCINNINYGIYNNGANNTVTNNALQGNGTNYRDGTNSIITHNLGYITENSGTQTCADNEDIAHGLAGIPTWIDVTPMNDTYDGKAIFATVDWSNVDATNIQVGLYWWNGTAISDDIILVAWKAEYEP